MIKQCLIISFIWHLFCALCFSFSLSPNQEFDIYSINFLGSILKETDFLVGSQALKVASRDPLPLSIFLLSNRGKSIKLYSCKGDSKKPFLALNKLFSEKDYLPQIYKKIGSESEQKKDIELIDIKPADWEKIKLQIND